MCGTEVGPDQHRLYHQRVPHHPRVVPGRAACVVSERPFLPSLLSL